MQLELAAVWLGQFAERPVVPASRPFQRRLCRHGVLLHPYGHRERGKVIAQLPSRLVSELVKTMRKIDTRR